MLIYALNSLLQMRDVRSLPETTRPVSLPEIPASYQPRSAIQPYFQLAAVSWIRLPGTDRDATINEPDPPSRVTSPPDFVLLQNMCGKTAVEAA
jgi:hypothetical protein